MAGGINQTLYKNPLYNDGIGPAAEHELVAVRGRLRHARRAHHSAGAADVLDDHLLAQNLGEAPADDASEHVGAAAGRERTTRVSGRVGQLCAAVGPAPS
jgi:hypothetical protein